MLFWMTFGKFHCIMWVLQKTVRAINKQTSPWRDFILKFSSCRLTELEILIHILNIPWELYISATIIYTQESIRISITLLWMKTGNTPSISRSTCEIFLVITSFCSEAISQACLYQCLYGFQTTAKHQPAVLLNISWNILIICNGSRSRSRQRSKWQVLMETSRAIMTLQWFLL